MPTREDADGATHAVHPAPCTHCGCTIFLADDDRELVWEPGARHGDGCAEPRCVCHRSAIVGDRHDLHTHEWDAHASPATRGGRFLRFLSTFIDLDGD